MGKEVAVLEKKMIECFECAGKGKVITDEWDREWDRFDQNSPSHYDTNRHMDTSGIEKYQTCILCKGSTQLEELDFNSLTGKNVKSVNKIKGLINELDSVRIEFDDNTFINIPYRKESPTQYLSKK
jgi:DNA-directed RNA polymerase subunit N (RpoN/RPB10)